MIMLQLASRLQSTEDEIDNRSYTFVSHIIQIVQYVHWMSMLTLLAYNVTVCDPIIGEGLAQGVEVASKWILRGGSVQLTPYV